MKAIKNFSTKSIMMSMALLMTISFTTAMANGPAKANKTIVEIAVSNADFSILVEALSKAELVDALNANGPFTVFAPTNDAFKALFKEIGVEGVSELTKDQLTPILLYHVVDGKVMASAVSTGIVPTLNTDSSLDVKTSKKGVVINKKSTVVKTDIEASNGVIHVIDTVMLPSTSKKTADASGSSCN